MLVDDVKKPGRGRLLQRVMTPVECLARLAAIVLRPRGFRVDRLRDLFAFAGLASAGSSRRETARAGGECGGDNLQRDPLGEQIGDEAQERAGGAVRPDSQR